jgi:hypothetical protein
MMRTERFLLLALCLASQCVGQWQREERTDAFRGTKFTEFKLEGRFLTPPRSASLISPALVIQCLPGEHSVGYHVVTGGKFLTAFLFVGPVMDSQLTALAVQFRLDDGKVQTEAWTVSKDFSSAFFPETTLNTLLYGHFLPHKEGTGPPTKTVKIAADQFVGGEVVMQFEMPDPTPLAEACGLVVHKRAK